MTYQPGWVTTRPRPLAAVGSLIGVLASAILAGHAVGGEKPQGPGMPRVRVSEDGKTFVLTGSGKRFVPWGFNYLGKFEHLTPEYLAIFHTGVTYQLVHTLALLGVALLAAQIPGRLVTWAGASFVIGILLFSGSLYLLTMTGISKLGIITPFGGLAFLVGWFCLGLAAWRLS